MNDKAMRKFSDRSLNNMQGVDARLVVVATEALNKGHVDFVVTEGLRTEERQRELVAAGASNTMNSKHLVGKAIDVAALVDGEVRWDWPLYEFIAMAFKDSARKHGIDLTWGGDWESFRDGPHFEVD